MKQLKKKHIIVSLAFTVVLLVFIVLIVRSFHQDNIKKQNESFVSARINGLIDINPNIDFRNVILYVTENETYLFIDYNVTYESETSYSYMIVEKSTMFIVRRGTEESYPDFISKFEWAKANYEQMVVYNATEIVDFIK